MTNISVNILKSVTSFGNAIYQNGSMVVSGSAVEIVASGKRKVGPTNVRTGQLAKFTFEFYDSNENTIVPALGGTLYMVFLNVNNVPQVDTINLTQVGSFFRGTWDSSEASLGLADWLVINNDDLINEAVIPTQVGQLRVHSIES